MSELIPNAEGKEKRRILVSKLGHLFHQFHRSEGDPKARVAYLQAVPEAKREILFRVLKELTGYDFTIHRIPGNHSIVIKPADPTRGGMSEIEEAHWRAAAAGPQVDNLTTIAIKNIPNKLGFEVIFRPSGSDACLGFLCSAVYDFIVTRAEGLLSHLQLNSEQLSQLAETIVDTLDGYNQQYQVTTIRQY